MDNNTYKFLNPCNPLQMLLLFLLSSYSVNAKSFISAPGSLAERVDRAR